MASVSVNGFVIIEGKRKRDHDFVPKSLKDQFDKANDELTGLKNYTEECENNKFEKYDEIKKKKSEFTRRNKDRLERQNTEINDYKGSYNWFSNWATPDETKMKDINNIKKKYKKEREILQREYVDYKEDFEKLKKYEEKCSEEILKGKQEKINTYEAVLVKYRERQQENKKRKEEKEKKETEKAIKKVERFEQREEEEFLNALQNEEDKWKRNEEKEFLDVLAKEQKEIDREERAAATEERNAQRRAEQALRRQQRAAATAERNAQKEAEEALRRQQRAAATAERNAQKEAEEARRQDAPAYAEKIYYKDQLPQDAINRGLVYQIGDSKFYHGDIKKHIKKSVFGWTDMAANKIFEEHPEWFGYLTNQNEEWESVIFGNKSSIEEQFKFLLSKNYLAPIYDDSYDLAFKLEKIKKQMSKFSEDMNALVFKQFESRIDDASTGLTKITGPKLKKIKNKTNKVDLYKMVMESNDVKEETGNNSSNFNNDYDNDSDNEDHNVESFNFDSFEAAGQTETQKKSFKKKRIESDDEMDTSQNISSALDLLKL